MFTMNNVSDITEKLDDWRIVSEFYTFDEGKRVVVWGNYRKTAHEIDISLPYRTISFKATDIAQLKKAIEDYENR